MQQLVRWEGVPLDEQELEEAAESAREPKQKRVALTMAVVAVLLATVTMLGHRSHTEEVVLQTKSNDQWTYYQAKNTRAHMYAADAKLASAIGKAQEQLAAEFQSNSEHERSGAEAIKKAAEDLDEETKTTAKKATHFDFGEILLEISIVLCSISLLTGSTLYWKLSFFSTIGWDSDRPCRTGPSLRETCAMHLSLAQLSSSASGVALVGIAVRVSRSYIPSQKPCSTDLQASFLTLPSRRTDRSRCELRRLNALCPIRYSDPVCNPWENPSSKFPSG